MLPYLVLLAFLHPSPDTIVKKQSDDAPKPTPHQKSDKGREENAAVLYKQAFELAPKKSDLTEAEVSALNDWQAATPDDVAMALLKRYEPVLQLIRQAKVCPKSDWGLIEALKKQGPLGLSMDSLTQARFLMEITRLQSRVLLAAGKSKEALDDLFAILTFIRRYDSGEMMMRKLVAVAMEQLILQEMARQIYPIQKVEILRELLKQFDAVPQAPTVADVLRREKEWMSDWMSQQKELNLTKTHLKEWEALANESARVAETPYAQREAALQQFDAKLKAVAPEIGPFKPMNPAKLCKANDIMVASRHLFRAGLTVLIDGPDAVRSTKDPFANGPFKFRRLAEGIELRSALRRVNDENIKIVFGKEDE